MLKWGDRYPFVGQVKGSTLLVDPGRFTLIVTSHYPIEQCFSGEAEREAMKGRFQEVERRVPNGPGEIRRMARMLLRSVRPPLIGGAFEILCGNRLVERDALAVFEQKPRGILAFAFPLSADILRHCGVVATSPADTSNVAELDWASAFR
jgi:hypothetical protein